MSDWCQQIDQYLDGTLESKQGVDFEAHLRSCSTCQLEVEIASSLDDRIRERWSNIEAPSHLKQLVANETSHKEKRFPTNYRQVVAIAVLAASVIVLAAISIWYLTGEADRNGQLAEHKTKPDSIDSVDSEPFVEGLVAVSATSTKGNSTTILVPEPRTSSNFTIIRAYSALNPLPPAPQIREN